MGVADLVEAFNLIAAPRFTATKALMIVERRAEAEWSRLTISGNTSDGTAFSESILVLPGGDLLQAAQRKARELLGDVPKLPAPEETP